MQYELLIVGTIDKGDSLVTRVEKTLKEASASNLKVDRLGKKPLAYKIKKQTDANYYLVNFEAEGAAIKSLTDKLRLEQEDLLRYLLLKNVEKKTSKKKVRVAEKAEEPVKSKPKPKVTVAVKKTVSVKSDKKKVSGASKVAKVSKAKKKIKSNK